MFFILFLLSKNIQVGESIDETVCVCVCDNSSSLISSSFIHPRLLFRHLDVQNGPKANLNL